MTFDEVLAFRLDSWFLLLDSSESQIIFRVLTRSIEALRKLFRLRPAALAIFLTLAPRVFVAGELGTVEARGNEIAAITAYLAGTTADDAAGFGGWRLRALLIKANGDPMRFFFLGQIRRIIIFQNKHPLLPPWSRKFQSRLKQQRGVFSHPVAFRFCVRTPKNDALFIFEPDREGRFKKPRARRFAGNDQRGADAIALYWRPHNHLRLLFCRLDKRWLLLCWL